MMRTFAAMLIKVKPGAETIVRDWLRQKKNKIPNKRHCRSKDKEKLEECILQNNNRPGFVCEKFTIDSMAYLTGQFDFAVVASMEDISMAEDFVVFCLRGGQMKDYILDTQTLIGAKI